MLASDWGTVLDDLDRMGLASCAQIDRPEKTGRSARGVAVFEDTPVAEPVLCYLTDEDEQLAAHGFGGSEEIEMLGLFLPETDLKRHDVVTVVEGRHEGSVFRVRELRTHGNVAASLERVKG